MDPIQSTSHLQIHGSGPKQRPHLGGLRWSLRNSSPAQLPCSNLATAAMGRWLDSTMLPQACDLQLSSTVCKQINEGWKPNGMPPSISFEKFLEKIKASILSQPLQPNCASRPKTTGSTLAPRASGLQHHILYSNSWCRCHFVYDVHVERHVKFTVSELLADSRVQLAHEHERFHPGWATQTDTLSFFKSSAAEFPTLAICCEGLDAPPVWQLGKG